MISSLLTHSLLLFSSVLTSWVSLTTSTTTTSSYGQQRPPNPHNNHGKILMMNQIDSCWRLDSTWATNRRVLAKCAKGFGRGAIGGEHGATYMVTDPSDDPINPKPGTLRYGAIQNEALWIIFNRDMVITLKNELMINSYKTIDGRGVNIEIAYGPCITIYRVKHIIIHGISIHDCKPGKPGLVRSSPERVRKRSGCDGDGIEIFSSSDIWIDHCFLARCTDGLLDVIHGSTAITVSNNYFTQHDKVMLLGNNDDFKGDNVMKVTVVFNHFGPGLVQRMPRVRIGYAHVVNNRYDEWKMYAIGGSANPTIFSQGNYFTAPNNPGIKQVTKRENINNIQGWKKWKWRSMEDEFENGAYFVESVMSADGEKDVIIDGINRGAALYFMKPLGMRQIKNLWQHTIEVMDTSQVLEGLENALTLEDDDDSTPEGVTNEEEDDSGSSNDEVNLEGKENDDQENRESVDSKEETEEQKDDETASQKKQRMMWTPDLHNKFLDAIESIGEEHVVPKRILEVMNVPGLTRENVASHLQKYRIYVKKLKEEDKNIERSRVRSMAQSALGTPAFASNYPTALPNIQQALSQYSQPSQNPLLRDEYFQGDEVVPPLDQPNSTNFHQPDPSRAAAERETQSLNNAVFEEIQNLTSDMPTMQQIVPQQNDIGSSYDNLSYQLQQLSSINNNNNFDGNSRMINPNPNSSGSLYTGPMPGGELSNIPNMNINYIDRHVSVVAGGVREPQVVSVPHETPIFSSDFTTQNEAYGDGFSNSNQFFELPSFNNVVTQELSSNHSLPPLPESMPPLPSMVPLPPLSPLPPLPEQLEVPTEQNGDGLLDELVRVLALM